MTGKYFLRVITRDLRFEAELERKYSILRGDSGSGKTVFAESISMYENQGSDSGVIVECELEVHRARTEHDLLSYKNCILVIDETDKCLRLSSIASLLQSSSCYFIIITREFVGYLSSEELDELSCNCLKEAHNE